jgi:hypothetical protein
MTINEKETLREHLNRIHPRKKRKKDSVPSTLWYILAVAFGLIGGLISYVATKDDYPDAALSMLILSFISTAIFVAVILWL